METMLSKNLESLNFFLPEIVLILTLVGVIVLDLVRFKKGRDGQSGALFLCLSGLALSGAISIWHASGDHYASDLFHGMIATDAYAVFFKVIFVICAIFLLLMAHISTEVDRRATHEFHTILIAITVGLMLMASSTDLLMIYLSIELVSILSYVAAGLQPNEARSREAALKYVIYGGAASGIMLFGMSLVFGMAGSTNLDEIRSVLVNGNYNLTLLFALALMLGGFGYKIAAAPFHMWAPDVYEGSPTPITAFFSVAPKAAGFAVIIRVFMTWFAEVEGGLGSFGDALGQLAGVMAIATMIVGNFGAMLQTNIKRFLAYSSIAHAGYLLMGVSLIPHLATDAGADAGMRAILMYLIFYVFMNLGAFHIGAMVIQSSKSEDISAFKGFGKRNPLAAIAMAIFLFSLAGLPPLAGFIGKFYLFAAVIDHMSAFNLLMLTVAIVTSVVAAYYYFRIVRTMFIDESVNTEPEPSGRLATALMLVFLVPTLVFGLYWQPVVDAVDKGINIKADPVLEVVDTEATPSTELSQSLVQKKTPLN
jgi:NADH-quinone oxidoreductase subunit N